MQMAAAFYITTPIYYVNAQPHLGHAYTTIVADVASRFHRMKQENTFFLTGTDEHGDKIVQAAAREGLSPHAYVDRISALFRNLWPELAIGNDDFIRTTAPGHMRVVSRILEKIYEQGDIYFSEYEGMYCFGCERFYTERELVDGKCPDHEVKPETIRESNYFFRMSRYQEWLVDHIRKNPDFIRPERYRNEVLAFLREPLEDLCISRPKSRLEWGITLPFDDRFVTYVWFDALINYISALGYPHGERYSTYWPAVQHVVAKDILKPHGIYWPIMLKAAGIPIYRHLNVHGFWKIGESKMSKSLGNMVEPLALRDRYGTDAFRYFLMREMTFGLDSSFTEEALIQRVNADLANDLGNLFSRVTAMCQKYFGGRVPEAETSPGGELAAAADRSVTDFEAAMDRFAFSRALQSVWEFIGTMNKHIDTTAPWVLAKEETDRPRLSTVIYELLEGLRVVAGLVYPIMPTAAGAMQRQLGIAADAPFYHLSQLHRWGALPAGTQLSPPQALFPRIDIPKTSPGPTVAHPARTTPEIKPEIDFEDFSRIDLRVATVVRAEAIPKARKLLKLEVDAGERRTIVAGIAGSYAPEDLVGKQVVIVANLKPAKLMGVRSEGMLLAAVADDDAILAILDRPAGPGTPLK